MSNKAQNPNDNKEIVLAFRHLDFNCNLDFDIWNLAKEIATPRLVGARNDKKQEPLCKPFPLSRLVLSEVEG